MLTFSRTRFGEKLPSRRRVRICTTGVKRLIRADELLSTPIHAHGTKKALISTKAKQINKPEGEVEKGPCLAKGCAEMVKVYLPLCRSARYTIMDVFLERLLQLTFVMDWDVHHIMKGQNRWVIQLPYLLIAFLLRNRNA
jgi:hypothetical protein